MSQPFMGQIQPFGFNFAPRYWAMCNGQILSISQNTALFALLGTLYGGNGTTTFALPNLQSRVPMHVGTFAGNSYAQGEQGGEEDVAINISTMPMHSHTFFGTTEDATKGGPANGSVLAKVHHSGGTTPDFYYAADTVPQPINTGSLMTYGGNQPHNNMQPFLAVNWCICTYGIFPSRN